MQAFKTAILVASLAALAGCASWQKDSSVASSGYDTSPICPKTHGWHAWNDVRCNPPEAPKEAGPDLAAELAAARKQNDALSRRASDLEKQLADSNREIAALQSSNTGLERQLAASAALAAGLAAGAGDKDRCEAELAAARQRNAELESQLAALRGELSAEMAKLSEAQRGLIRALRPEIEKGDITVDLNNERLMINLASSYLFGSGQAELKPAGVEALKQVGAVLKDFPEYKVAVDGHTDNRPIQGALKKKFPSNKELSEARAANAAKALTEGGLGAATTHGYADTKPVESNTTDANRAKNRRVEIRVTK
jgi:chemotaxis protein MotB